MILGLPVMKIIEILHLFIADNYLFDTQPVFNFDERGPKTKKLLVLIISHIYVSR